MEKFDDITYLETGSPIQQQAFSVLRRYRILEKLVGFAPLLIGTVPIDIAIEESDLDIACTAVELAGFKNHVLGEFEHLSALHIADKLIRDVPTVIVNFTLTSFRIELFCQSVPVKQQYGYRHMIKEYEILNAKGEEFRRKIIALKRQGIKTEPAFAQLLDIQGNPYEELLIE